VVFQAPEPSTGTKRCDHEHRRRQPERSYTSVMSCGLVSHVRTTMPGSAGQQGLDACACSRVAAGQFYDPSHMTSAGDGSMGQSILSAWSMSLSTPYLPTHLLTHSLTHSLTYYVPLCASVMLLMAWTYAASVAGGGGGGHSDIHIAHMLSLCVPGGSVASHQQYGGWGWRACTATGAGSPFGGTHAGI